MSQWRHIKDKCPLNLRHTYSCVPFGFGSQILNMITSTHSQLRKQKNTPWILIPLYWPHWGFSSKSDLNMKTKQKGCLIFPRELLLFLSSFCYLFPHWLLSSCFHCCGYPQHTDTHRGVETYKKTDALIHTHMHTQRYIQTQRALFQDAVSSRTEATGNTGWILLCLIPSHCHDTPIYLLHPSPCWLSTTLARLSLCMYVCMMCVSRHSHSDGVRWTLDGVHCGVRARCVPHQCLTVLRISL